MKKFMALYMAPPAAFEQVMSAPPEQRQEGMAEWTTWAEERGSAIADMGAPLGKTKKIDPHGISDIKNSIGGYSIVQAGSAEEAAAIFENNPHFRMIPGGWIEIMECMPM